MSENGQGSGVLAAYERLQALLGIWRTQGSVIDDAGVPTAAIDAVDTYSRLPGGPLLHTVDARVGDEVVEGAEIIGYDPERQTYATQYFGTDGPATYDASLEEDAEGLTWGMRGSTTRFSGRFDGARTAMTGRWELRDGDRWRQWMDITLTKRPD